MKFKFNWVFDLLNLATLIMRQNVGTFIAENSAIDLKREEKFSEGGKGNPKMFYK